MYANKKNLAALFGVTPQTVHRRVKGIEALIGERYNQYAMWWSSGRCRTLHNAGLSGRRCDQCSCGRNGQRISGDRSKSVI